MPSDDPAGAAGRRPGSRGSGRPGPTSAVSVTWWPSPSASVRAASTRATSRRSGTHEQRAAPRGVRRRGRVRRARPASRCRARPPRPPAGEPPSARCVEEGRGRARGRPRRPGRRPRSAAGVGGGADGSLLGAWRAGAGRRAGARRRAAPAYRSATAPVSAATSGASTGSALTTRRSGAQPAGVVGLAAARSTTKPSTSWPAKRTLTRAPGTAASASLGRDEVVEGPVEVGQRQVDQHPGDRVGSAPARPRRPCARRVAAALARESATAARRPGSSSAAPSRLVMAVVYQRRSTSSRWRRSPGCVLGPMLPGTSTSSPAGRETAADAQTPTAALSASTRSVRSQVNSGSSRPKWP